MRNERLTYRILLFISALLIAACSNDSDEFKEPDNCLSMVSFTRGDEPSNPFTVTEDYSPVGVFLVEGDGTTQSGRFVFKANETIWKSSIEVTSNHDYAIYGYAPANVGTVTLSDETLDGATMTFSNLPTVSSQDICFVVGVQQVNNINDTKNIPLGQFGFTGKSEKNFVNLLMDHVYASICFKVEIDPEYAALRDIKLRGMTLQSTKATAKATVTLAANTENTSPVVSATYSDLAGTGREAQFFDSDTGVDLTADAAIQATCCFVPTLANDLSLITTYDVYDRKTKKISERTATNKLPNITIARGKRMTMTLTVQPTYLYVLSDNDLDNPTITIN
jgi:hypothetical protein